MKMCVTSRKGVIWVAFFRSAVHCALRWQIRSRAAKHKNSVHVVVGAGFALSLRWLVADFDWCMLVSDNRHHKVASTNSAS